MTGLSALAVEHIHCPYCGAAPRQRCRTATGNTTYWPHGDRVEPVRLAWWDGYADGVLEWATSVLAAAKDGRWERLVKQARANQGWIERERAKDAS